MSVRRLVLLLGDQLDPQISSLRDADPARDRILLVEAVEEGRYVPHHPQKILFILSAMRHFADSWGLLAMTLFFASVVVFTLRPGSRKAADDAASIPLKED